MNQEQFTARVLNNSLTHQIGDEVVIYDGDQARCLSLNPAAAAVFARCSTGANIDELTSAVASAELPANSDVAYLALEELKSANLLAGNPVIPAKAGGVNRRQLLMGLGVAAVMLPTVRAVASPKRVIAASGPIPE